MKEKVCTLKSFYFKVLGLNLLLSFFLFCWFMLWLIDSFNLFFFFLFLWWSVMLLNLFYRWIQFKTLNALSKIKTVQIIECHQMTITSKNVHKIIPHTDCLTISCTRFLADNLSVCLIVNYFLFLFLFCWLLVTYIKYLFYRSLIMF